MCGIMLIFVIEMLTCWLSVSCLRRMSVPVWSQPQRLVFSSDDGEWTSGICDCCDDMRECTVTLFIPLRETVKRNNHTLFFFLVLLYNKWFIKSGFWNVFVALTPCNLECHLKHCRETSVVIVASQASIPFKNQPVVLRAVR